MNSTTIVFDKLKSSILTGIRVCFGQYKTHALVNTVAVIMNHVKVVIRIFQEKHDCGKLYVVNKVMALIIIVISICTPLFSHVESIPCPILDSKRRNKAQIQWFPKGFSTYE